MKPKVLIVDDQAEFLQLLEYNLAQHGFEVFTAVNGVEALREARRLSPDVILLDLMLPDLDGLSVCQILRSRPSTAAIPVIVVSALNGPSVYGKSAKTGVNGFFKKPVDLRVLGESVRSLVNRQKNLTELDSDESHSEFCAGSEMPTR